MRPDLSDNTCCMSDGVRSGVCFVWDRCICIGNRKEFQILTVKLRGNAAGENPARDEINRWYSQCLYTYCSFLHSTINPSIQHNNWACYFEVLQLKANIRMVALKGMITQESCVILLCSNINLWSKILANKEPLQIIEAIACANMNLLMQQVGVSCSAHGWPPVQSWPHGCPPVRSFPAKLPASCRSNFKPPHYKPHIRTIDTG
jgi:hypothetical protein